MCRKDRKIYKASRTKEDNCRKTLLLQKRICGSFERSLSKWRRVPFFLSNKVGEKKRDAGCRNGGRASDFAGGRRKKRQQCLVGANRVEAMFQRYRAMGAAQGQMPGREEGRSSEDRQEQDKASQQLALGQAGVMEALQRVEWSLILLVFGVHSVNAEKQGSQEQQRMSEKRLSSNSPSRLP